MTALIKVTVTATYRGKSYTGEAEVEVERLDQKYMIAHMDLIRDLPAGREGERVPLRDRDYDAGSLAWSPQGWLYEPRPNSAPRSSTCCGGWRATPAGTASAGGRRSTNSGPRGRSPGIPGPVSRPRTTAGSA